MNANYVISITVQGNDRASGPLKGVSGVLGGLATVAGGILSAQLFSNIASGIMDIGRQALGSYAKFERLGMSLQSLAARELLNTGRANDMTDAMSKSVSISQDLLSWIQKLAIQSPFTQDDVSGAFRLAMAYGFTSKEAQRLTAAMIDFASGSGASGDTMNRISLALGQIKARGKLAGQELMQLTETGLPVREILAKSFGVTTAELEKMISDGLVPADKAIEAITTSLEKDFGGAAKRQASTFSGLISSLSDIKDVGLREFFTGTFKAIQPYLNKFVDKFSDPAFMGGIRKMGDEVGQFVARVLSLFEKLGDITQGNFDFSALGKNMLTGLKSALGVLVGGGALAGLGSILGTGLITGITSFFQSGILGATILSIFSMLPPAIVQGFGVFVGPILIGVIGLLTRVNMALLPLMRIFGPLAGILGQFAGLLTPLLPILGQLGMFIGIAVGVLTLFGVVMQALNGNTQFFKGIVDTINHALANFGLFWLQQGPAIISIGKQIFDKLVETGTSLANQVLPFLAEQFNVISVWFVENGPLITRFIQVLADGFTQHLLPAIVGVWQVIAPLLGGIVQLILGLVTVIMQIATGDWAGAWQTIGDTAQSVWVALQGAFMGFLNWVTGWFGTSWQGVMDQWASNWEQLKLIVSRVIENITTWLTNKRDDIGNSLSGMWEQARSLVVNKVEEIKLGIQTKFTEMVQGVIAKMTEIKTGIHAKFVEIFAAMGLDFDAMVTRWSNIWSNIQLLAARYWQQIQTTIGQAVADAMLAVIGPIVGLVVFLAGQWTQIQSLTASLWQNISIGLEALGAFLYGKWIEIVSTVTTTWNNILQLITTKAVAIMLPIAELGVNIFETFNNIKDDAVGKIIELVSRVLGYFDSLKSQLIEKASDFIDIGAGVVGAIITGLEQNAGALLEYLTGLVEDLISSLLGGTGSETTGIGKKAISGGLLGSSLKNLSPGQALGGGSNSNWSDSSTKYYAPVTNNYPTTQNNLDTLRAGVVR